MQGRVSSSETPLRGSFSESPDGAGSPALARQVRELEGKLSHCMDKSEFKQWAAEQNLKIDTVDRKADGMQGSVV